MATLSNLVTSLSGSIGSSVTTTNATPTVISRAVIRTPGCYLVHSKVIGVRATDHAQVGTYWHEVSVSLTDAGVLAFNPAATWREVVADNESDANWNVEFDTNVVTDVDGDGTNEKLLRTLVTGAAGTTIHWKAVTDITMVT